MKKRNGFTLIELLAVIVILAIIALISVPMVLKYIEISKKEAFKESIINIEKEALNFVASKQINNEPVEYPYEINIQDLNLKGKKDNYTGRIIVHSSSVVESYISDGIYQHNNNTNEIKKINQDVILQTKEGQTAIIDDKNNYVYSFFNSPIWHNYRTYLTLDILNNTFEATNGGSVEFVKNNSPVPQYTTGAQIILKDKEGHVIKTYKIVIFGDNTGAGLINGTVLTKINAIIADSSQFPDEVIFSSDANFDGKVDETDLALWKEDISSAKHFNQITRKFEE